MPAIHEGADEDVEDADQQKHQKDVRGQRSDTFLNRRRNVVKGGQLSECQCWRQQDQDAGQQCCEAQRLDDLCQRQFAVNEQANEQGIEDGNPGGFGWVKAPP